jgi:hypothetical protein
VGKEKTVKEILGWVIGGVVATTTLYLGMLAVGVSSNLAATCFFGLVNLFVFVECMFVQTRHLADIFRQPVTSVYKGVVLSVVALCVVVGAGSFSDGPPQLQNIFMAFVSCFFVACPLMVFFIASDYEEGKKKEVFFAHLIGGVGIYDVGILRTWWLAALAVAALSVWWLVLDRKEKRVVAP